eukprot:gene31083-37566_t
METIYEPVFITGAANTVAQSIVWFTLNGASSGEQVKTDCVAYALCNHVAVASVSAKQVLFTLRSQQLEDRINAVCHVQHKEDCAYILSAGDTGFVSIWKITFNATLQALEQEFMHCLASEGKSLSSICAIEQNGRLSVVAADTVGSLFLWECNPAGATWQLTRTLRFPTAQMPNSLAIHRLTPFANLLVVGSVDSRVHMYVQHSSTGLTAAGHLSGHEEWITSLCLASPSSAIYSPVFLASASQDNKIRIWKIWTSEGEGSDQTNVISVLTSVPSAEVDPDEDDDDMGADETAVTLAYDDSDAMEKSEAKASFLVDNRVYYVSLEGLLVGHEDWVTSVCWNVKNNTQSSPHCLFSTSMDRNMIVWELDAISHAYIPNTRVGDMGGALGGSVGGNLLGFVGGVMSPCGEYLCGIGYGGSFHLWQHDSLVNRWYPVKFLSGHFDTVEDVVYDLHDGQFVVTVSHDQTCRIFAPTYPTKDPSPSSSMYPYVPSNSKSQLLSLPSPCILRTSYHEVSRPQIHGYDLNCVVLSYGLVDGEKEGQKHAYTLLTGGEEKVIRVFDMPKIVYDGLQTLSHVALYAHTPSIQQAYIPELGLSNKGREHATQQEVKDQMARGVSDIDWSMLPLESQLADYTLWIEVEKLYGHQNDVLCMATTLDGKFMVSSSKARYGQDSTALLLLWRLKPHVQTPTSHDQPLHTSYDVVQALPGNTSTVVCLQFSRNNQYLATGSKDRKLCMYSYDAQTQAYENVLVVSSAHKRIIWDLCWHPNNELLVTASRDGTAKIWQLTCADQVFNLSCVNTITTPHSTPLTSVCVYHSPVGLHAQERNVVLIGGEDGFVYVYFLHARDGSYEIAHSFTLPSEYAHTKAVKKIKCRPGQHHKNQEKAAVEFATCGDDHTVRIHKLYV